MSKLTYYIVDVFARGKYTGNQLAVFRNAGTLSEREMQQIAKEINYSETSFILTDSKEEGSYNVRIFTPTEELPFAGHPTLGTAYIIQSEILDKPLNKLTLNYQIGKVPVSFDIHEQILWMSQIDPTFGRIFNINKLSEVLNIERDDISSEYPIQEVSTGLPVIIVPLKSLEAVKKVKINRQKYYDLIEYTQAKAIMVFSPEVYNLENDLHVRDFAEYYGIPEDAATGSSNGCLASYLVKYQYFGIREINLRVEQGYEIQRPSLLFIKASECKGRINVDVGGRVLKLAEGKWFL